MTATTEALVASLSPITTRVARDRTAIKVGDGSSRWTDEPLTEQRLLTHVSGGMPRGVCPIERGSSLTRLALLDLDSHKGETPWADMCATAQTLAAALSMEGLTTIPFRSSGGRGLHLFMLWDTPQDAYSVRQHLMAILAAVGFKNGAGGVARGEVEVFPKQDRVDTDGYGNQFILPLAGLSAPLDPATLAPLYVDAMLTLQWPLSAAVPCYDKPLPAPRLPIDLNTPLCSALAAIPNTGEQELDYDQWRNVIFALHYATDGSADGLAMAHDFSARSSKHDPAFLDERVWPYITHTKDNPVTERTILHLARQYGWTEDLSDEFDVLPDDPAGPVTTSSLRFAPIQAALFAQQRPVSWLIKHILPAADLAVLYGASGSGKSFMALDMACAIALGIPWRGHITTKARVAYVCAEGAGGFRRRLQAYAHQHQVPLDTIDLFVIPAAPNLLKGDDVRDLVKALQAAGTWGLVILDTFAQVMPGGNENSGEDVGKALGHCKVLNAVLQCPVLLIHHSGKDEARGARGWSGLRAACDTELEVLRAENDRVMSVTKQKDGEEGLELGFKLLTVTLGLDDDDEPITSCVVEHTEGTVKAVRGRKLGPVENLVYKTLLDNAEADDGGIDRTALIALAIDQIVLEDGKRDRRKERVNRALEELLTRKVVVLAGSRCVLPSAE